MTPDQLTLPTARAGDPWTSKAAAASIGRGVEYAVMDQHHLWERRGGLTDSELVALLPNSWPDTVKSARSRLSKRGLLRDSGATRLSARGKPSIVWVIA